MRAFFYILSPFLFIYNLSFAQNTEGGGIAFIHEKFSDALSKAKTENKILFIDAYTVWCAPCKLMDKTVFTEKEVVAYYNQQFVNLKLNMEKGEGTSIAQKYGITAFPTLLFLDSEGELVHKGVGFVDADKFIELGKTASNAEQSLSNWVKKYEKGNREPMFLKEYALKLAELYDNRRFQIANDYLATQTEWNTPDNLEFIYSFVETTETKLYEYLVKNRKAFETQFEASDIDLKIQGLISDRLFNEKNLPTLAQADSLILITYPNTAARMKANYRLNFYRLKGDREKYAQSAIEYFKKFNASADELSEAAIIFHEQIQDKSLLKKAIKWAQKAIKLDNSYMNLFILAQLQADIAKKAKAQKTAHLAIEKAKANGDSYTEAEEFLKKLK